MFLNPRPSGLCRLITQYLFTRSQWRLWGLFAIVLAAYAFNIKLAVLYNDWNGRFFNALQAVNRDAIFRELFYFIGLAAVIIVLLVWAGYVKDRLALALRRDLTQIFFKRWLSPESAHYLLRESGREPDNPDQRVTEDVRQLVNLSVDLLVSFYDAMLTIGSFSVILWQLSGSAEVFGITIPGYMFWVCILYTIVATWITHLIGHKLKGLNINAQHMEANLRAALMEKRRHADAIAGAHAEAVEEAGLVERFRQLLSVLIALVKRKRDLNLFTVGVGQFTHLAPIFFALPSFFAGIIQLGGLMQIRGAFNDVARSLSWIIMSYDDLAALAAAYERLRRLEAGLSEADDQRRALEKRCQDNSCTGLTAALDLIVPNGKNISRVPVHLKLVPGSFTIVCGHLASENPRFSKSFQASPEITKVNSLNADPSSGCRSSLICQKESSSLRSPIRKVLKRSRSRQHRNCSVPHTSTISKKSFTTRATGLHCFPAVNSSGFLCCGLLLSNLTSCFSTK